MRWSNYDVRELIQVAAMVVLVAVAICSAKNVDGALVSRDAGDTGGGTGHEVVLIVIHDRVDR